MEQVKVHKRVLGQTTVILSYQRGNSFIPPTGANRDYRILMADIAAGSVALVDVIEGQ